MSIGKNANRLIILKMLNKKYLLNCGLVAVSKGERTTRGFQGSRTAMLASEYILIDISLISCSPNFTNITELWNIPSAFYL